MSKNMTKKRRRTRQEEKEQSTNWTLIGGIIALGVVGLIGLLVAANMSPQTAAEPTPVLNDQVANLDKYCEDYPDRCIINGNPEATTSFVEISDYGCPHCYAFNTEKAPTLQERYLDTGDLRWILLPFALGELTKPSAGAVFCAAEQSSELALEFHELVFQLQGTGAEHTPDGFTSVAQQIEGMDVDALDACVAAERHLDKVSLNQQAARQIGANSTPTFFLNGSRIQGNQEMNVFLQRIDAVLDN